ncbi:regulatory protein, luxR family [Salegentibacter holothuriorum]|uniref:Regulatory protein, luxR family n=1 Tax=Salegentibacter holothuriorum TaxID=241145 RepID=A0A1T5BXS9_9FLAO|nr:triple tyrosine motif-containing protein [Salegentibacter holothuriorum]SKB51937.1 regulatory protein, luxR family [Salegentibacter holothuriorum]
MRLLAFFIFFSYNLFAQELPPITNFDPGIYNAGNQNWMISQGSNNHIFIANNLGLLSFNGQQWNLHRVPNASAVRSVLAHDDRIYTGSYMDFGFWKHNKKGELTYTSLTNLSKEALLDGEQFWHIAALEEYIVFQSLRRLYSYNKKTGQISTIAASDIISNLFSLNNKLYYQVADDGLYVIDNGLIERVITNSKIKDKPIVGLFPFEENKILAVTRDDGLFTIEGNNWKPYKFENYPIDESIFTAQFLEDKTLILGSIGNGLHVYNLETSLNYQLLQPVINNNTVLSIMVDKAGNIWGGLDNGLVLINRKSPFRLFTDIYGKVGTVYSSYKFQDYLYLGTNQGLYVSSDTSKNYELISGTSGQVWSINEIGGKLFAGHDRGVFAIQGIKATHIFDGPGVWEIKEFKDGLLQGHYDGISFWEDDKFDEDPEYLANFDLSSRNLVVENDSVIWVGHDHKGIFRLEIDTEVREVQDEENYIVSYQGGMGLKVFEFNDSIYYSTEDEIYKYNPSKNKFIQENNLSTLIKEPRITGISEVLPDNTWWGFGKENLIYATRDAFQDRLSIKSVRIPIEYRTISKGFENISLINEREYLVGSNLGYTIFSTPLGLPDMEKLSINKVSTASLENKFNSHELQIEELELPNSINNINFEFSMPVYSKLTEPVYSYRIKGYSTGWSDWQAEGNATFENLPSGDYVFEVRGKYNNKLSDIASYAFSIALPWYATTTAIIIYVLLFLLLIFILHKIYTGYFRKQQNRLVERNRKQLEIKQLESQQEIITLQNQKLESDMESKNRELAASTMNLIKKNEFLNELKKKLSSANSDADIQTVISVINKNIAEKDNWKLFKEAFDNADKDFLQSVKEAHPNLTSNDLKLCAYLRLNLSSKEIAPLLNISVRSVEIKRYRLRKKMELDHDQGLVEYILKF